MDWTSRSWKMLLACAACLVVGAAVMYFALRWPRAGPLLGEKNPDHLKALIDTAASIVTALATLGLLIVTSFGLQQLRLAKLDLRIRSRREARSIAIAQCERFAREIIEPHNRFTAALRSAAIPPFDLTGLPIDFDSKNAVAAARAKDWVVHISPELQATSIGILNTLETWAMNFTLRIADAEAAYPPASNVFCTVVVQLYPVALTLRSINDPELFPNIAALYNDWNGRKNAAQARRLQSQLVQRLRTFDFMQREKPHPRPLGDDN